MIAEEAEAGGGIHGKRWVRATPGGKEWVQRFLSAPTSQVHAYIISSLKKEMPSVFGKENKKKELVSNLAEIYGRIEREHQISPGDFPNLKRMQVTGAPGLQDKGQCHTSWPRRGPALDAPDGS